MKYAVMAAIFLTGCAGNQASINAASRNAELRYNRCVDQVHDLAKTRKVDWSAEIDACLGVKGREYTSADEQMPTRQEWEAR